MIGKGDAADLGFTLSHELVGVGSAGLGHTYPEFSDRQGILEEAVADLTEDYNVGLRTRVDTTTFGPGRDINLTTVRHLSAPRSIRGA